MFNDLFDLLLSIFKCFLRFRWRLGVHCTGGQKYQVCGNSCSHTCLDLATNPDCKRKCVEGCNCPDGFSLDQDGICVPITDCPCVFESKEYKPGYEMLQRQPDGSDMVW